MTCHWIQLDYLPSFSFPLQELSEIFSLELAKYDPQLVALRLNMDHQKSLLAQLGEANLKLAEAR